MATRGLSSQIEELKQELEKDPTSRAFVRLADAYIKQAMLKEATDVLDLGLLHHPDHVAGWNLRGQVYLQQGDVEQAKTTFLHVLSVHPENVQAYRRLATLYKGGGEFPAAMEACQAVLRIDPSDREAKAIRDEMARQMSETPQHGVVSATLAALYMNQGHYEKAAETYRGLVEKEPDRLEHQNGLETALKKMGEVAAKNRSTAKITILKEWLATIKKNAPKRTTN